MNRNKKRYKIKVIFNDYTKKTYIRYFKNFYKLDLFIDKLTDKYNNIRLITTI